MPNGHPQRSKTGSASLRRIAAFRLDLALAGDTTALRICIDRLIPPVREDRMSIRLPAISDVAGCSSAQARIMAAVASGELLPSEGEALSGLVEHQRRALDTTEFAKRLEAIEAKLNVKERSS